MLPFPSQAQRSKLSVGRPYYQFPSPVPRPPVLFKLRALKPDQGLSSLTRGFQGRPGASKPDMDGHFGHFQISDIGFQILDIRFWISDFGCQILNFRFQISGFGFHILEFRFETPDFEFWILDFGFQILDFRF